MEDEKYISQIKISNDTIASIKDTYARNEINNIKDFGHLNDSQKESLNSGISKVKINELESELSATKEELNTTRGELSSTKIELANTTNELNIAKKSIVPVGIIYPFGGSNEKVPAGYLPCDGRAVSRTQYSALFNVIGTSFGYGDYVSTFNLPDMRESVPVGIGTRGSGVSTHDTYTLGQFKDDRIQNIYINGGKSCCVWGENGQDIPNSPFTLSGSGHWAYGGSTIYGQYSVLGFDASRNVRTGSTTHGKQVGVNYIIKY